MKFEDWEKEVQRIPKIYNLPTWFYTIRSRNSATRSARSATTTSSGSGQARPKRSAIVRVTLSSTAR